RLPSAPRDRTQARTARADSGCEACGRASKRGLRRQLPRLRPAVSQSELNSFASSCKDVGLSDSGANAGVARWRKSRRDEGGGMRARKSDSAYSRIETANSPECSSVTDIGVDSHTNFVTGLPTMRIRQRPFRKLSSRRILSIVFVFAVSGWSQKQ